MALGFKGGYAGAQVRLFEYILSSLAPFLRRRQNAAFPDKRREQHEHLLATARAAARAGREEPTNLDHRNRPTRWGDEPDNDHDGDDDDDENRDADYDGRRMRMGRDGLLHLSRL